MRKIVSGSIGFADEQSARFWLSTKVLEAGFVMGRIRKSAGKWRVEWAENGDEHDA